MLSGSTWTGELPAALDRLQQRTPVLLIFLRHFGCTFCREAVRDVARSRGAIEAAGTQIAFVHMSNAAEADRWFAKYGVPDVPRFADPGQALYRQFGLEHGTLSELAHPRVWGPWFRTAVLERHGAGRSGPKWRQLTGVFAIHRGRILSSIRHRNSSERPDYVTFVQAIRGGSTIRTD